MASPSYGHPFCVPRVFTYRGFHCILNCKGSGKRFDNRIFTDRQRAKKVVSDSQGYPGVVDFAIGLVNPVLNVPKGQVKFFWEIQVTEEL